MSGITIKNTFNIVSPIRSQGQLDVADRLNRQLKHGNLKSIELIGGGKDNRRVIITYWCNDDWDDPDNPDAKLRLDSDKDSIYYYPGFNELEAFIVRNDALGRVFDLIDVHTWCKNLDITISTYDKKEQ